MIPETMFQFLLHVSFTLLVLSIHGELDYSACEFYVKSFAVSESIAPCAIA